MCDPPWSVLCFHCHRFVMFLSVRILKGFQTDFMNVLLQTSNSSYHVACHGKSTEDYFTRAIPIGASVFYLLWTYAWKKKGRSQGDKLNKAVVTLPSIAITAGSELNQDTQSDSGVHDRTEDGVQASSSTSGNVSECDGNSFSAPEELDVSSLSCEHSQGSDHGEQLENGVAAFVPPDLVLDLQPESGLQADSAVQPSVTEHNTSVLPVETAITETSQSALNCCPPPTEPENIHSEAVETQIVAVDAKTQDACNKAPSPPDNSEAVVEVAQCEMQTTTPLLSTVNAGSAAESGNFSWASAVSSENIDGETADKEGVQNEAVSSVSVRKDSTSDGNSRNSSRDRNGNDCKRINRKNKNVGQQQPEPKDKSLKSHAFDFPTEFCGQLIGRRGHNVALIKEKCGVEIYIRPKMYNTAWQVVTLEGTRLQVNKALDMIRRRFPSKFFPGIDFNRSLPDVPVLPAELMQLVLPSGVPLDVVVCHVVTPNHVFVQQPTHPTFPSLERQTINMRSCYGVDDVPSLPRPIDVGVICAAPIGEDWYRAQIVQTYPDSDEYDLKLVDYGGYVHILGSSLRQIRSDFMLVPFQAIECYLANVIPLKDDEDFAPEAKTVLEELVNGSILQCIVTAVEADGVPYVQLTKVNDRGLEAVMVNRELVERQQARWLEM